MTSDCRLTFYHSPETRSTGVFTLLEELGAPYELKALNMKAGEQRESAYLAVNPMGKVPAIVHGDALVTEQGAVYIYLADLFPEAGLAPAIGDPLRGPYLRWIVFYGSSFEPAVVDRSMQREPARLSTSPYGDFDTMLSTLVGQLRKGPVSSRRALLGRRYFVGLGAALDHGLQARSRASRDHGLCRAGDVAAVLRDDRGARRRAFGAPRRAGVNPDPIRAMLS